VKLPAFDYERPTSVEDAVQILVREAGEAKLLAGGQTLVPVMAFRLASPTVLVDLGGIPCLREVSVDAAELSVGAMARWCDLESDPRIKAACPIIPAAIEHIAHYQIRNRGTIGGSLAHADPAAEMPGITVVCDASIDLVGPKGTRTVAAGDFFLGPLTTCLEPDEVLQRVRFPVWSTERRWAFEEFAQRRGDFALAGVAVHYEWDDQGVARDAHLVVIGASNSPRRLAKAERALNGHRITSELMALVASIAAAEVEVHDEPQVSAAYRRSLVNVLVERAIHASLHRGAGT
jgi:carbon-monoxide dehydrogenase medium subunit